MVVVDAPATGHIVGQLAAPQAVNGLVKRGADPLPDRLDARHPVRPGHDRAGGRVHARGDAGHRDHGAGRAGARGDHRRAGRRSSSTGSCPSCSGAARRRSSSAARPRVRWASSTSWSAATPARSSRPPGWPSPCAGPGRPTSSACARGIDPDVPLLYLPYLFARSHGLRTTRQVAGSLGEELGSDGGPRRGRPQGRRRPDAARAEHGRPAGHQGDRGGVRPRGRRQDDHGGGLGAHGRHQPRLEGPGAHRRPGQAAGQRPRARRHRQHRAPGARRAPSPPPA